MKAIKHWQKKLKETLEDGKISYVHGLEKLILWEWPYYQNQLTNLT
jgi:hypothetical protein